MIINANIDGQMDECVERTKYAGVKGNIYIMVNCRSLY